MPGPRAKQNAAKKDKRKVSSQNNSATLPTHVLDNRLEELSNDDWDKVAEVLCDHLKLPDLNTRAGLKKVYHNFNEICKRIDDMYSTYAGNQVIRGGIVAIYVKMSADSILRNMVFRRGLLTKVIDLIDKPNSRHLVLRALVTVTQHGGSDVRKEIALQAPVLIKVLQDFPEDLYAAELAISTIAHAITCSLDETEKRLPEKYLKVLQLPKLIPLVVGFVSKPGVSLLLLHHALGLFVHITQHCRQDCQGFPDMIDFLIASIRSGDIYSRFCALGAVIRSQTPVLERVVGDPYAMIAAMQRGLPSHLERLLMEYGPPRCESFLTLQSFTNYQKAMMRCTQDRDLYKLGLALAELIPRNEFSISEGGFQTIDERTGRHETMDTGLPFKMWVDALPVCAKAIRERGRVGEEPLADMLDMKFFVIRSRIPEAIAVAKKGIERDPRQAYPYYIMSLGDDLEVGLRYAKKGLKCRNATPFVSHVLRARATEIAGELAICRMQESNVGDRRWDQAQAFLTSALDDAQIFLSQAPPDMRHRRSILQWYVVLTLAKRGPELSVELRELQSCVDQLKIADEFFAEFRRITPRSQLRMAQERILSRYAAAARKWDAVVARFDSHGLDEYVPSRDKAEDRLAVWLNDVRDEDGDDEHGHGRGHRDEHSHDHGQTEGPSSGAAKRIKNPTELHRCAWCGNPSAVLRKCGGCERSRYCDHTCQKLAWSEHKGECKSRKTASSSA